MSRHDELIQKLGVELEGLGTLETSELLIQHVLYEEAVEVLEGALAQGFDASIAAQLAKALLMLERYDEALDWLEKAPDPQVAQLFADHFEACLQVRTTKHFAHPDLDRWVSRFRSFCDLTPSKEKFVGVSACLIVKNEEQHLERCLRSLKGRVDEIIVVDTGSTDRTVKIAESYGATIGHFKWINDFAEARNASLDLVTQPWILWIDADEELVGGCEPYLLRAQSYPCYASYSVIIRNIDSEGASDSEAYLHTADRLFQNHPKIRFEGRIHESIKSGVVASGLYVRSLYEVNLNHYGYSEEMMLARGKDARNLELITQELEKNPNDPFQLFNLANTHSAAGRSTETIEQGRKCIANLPKGAAYGFAIFPIVAGAMLTDEKWTEIDDLVTEAEEKGFGSLLLDYAHATALLSQERLGEALRAIHKCIAQEWPSYLIGDKGIFIYKKYILQAQILTAMRQFTEAEGVADLVLTIVPGNAEACFFKGLARMAVRDYEKAVVLFAATQEDPHLGIQSRLRTAACLTHCTQYEPALRLFEGLIDDGYTVVEDIGELIIQAQATHSWWAVAEGYRLLARMGQLTTIAECQYADALARFGKLPDAMKMLMGVIQVEPQLAAAYFTMGDALYRAEHFVDAQEYYRLGLERQPDHAEGWFCLGNALAQMGAAGPAVQAYEMCLQFYPDHSAAAHNRTIVAA